MKIAIIGAGIAGLAAANYLVDKGQTPYLIDADVPGKPKVCGEFFSPEVIEQLEAWGVPLSYKKRAILHIKHQEYTFEFDKPVASVSRMIIENHLAQRARQHGAHIFTKTRVANEHFDRSDTGYVLKLIGSGVENGELEVDRLIIAGGRFFAQSGNLGTSKPRYIGIKAYFTGIVMPHDELHMYSNGQGYAGMSVSEEVKGDTKSMITFCCLADAEAVTHAGGPEQFINKFIESSKKLRAICKQARNRYGWITVPVYAFGQKETPKLPQSYFCGDAAASIYPATGNGLAMGITSAEMAVNYALEGNDQGYRDAWQARYANRLEYAKVMHYLFMHPSMLHIGFSLTKFFPKVAQKLYCLTRD